MPQRFPSIAVLILLLLPAWSMAEPGHSWPRWRGPEDHGSVETGTYPNQLDQSSRLWQIPLPGKGCSTPIANDGTIYLTAPRDGRDTLMAFSELDGSPTWQTSFGQEEAGRHRNGSGSNASPTTDGDAIFIFFKSGTLAAVERDGTIRWQTNLVERYGKDSLFWDHGTSPVTTQQYVVMTRMHQGESWLAAFDKRNGELAWKQPRNYKTKTENDHGYATPLVIDYQGREALLAWGAEHLTIHDATDGKVLWSCSNFNPDQHQMWPSIATPVIVSDMCILAYGRNDRGDPRMFGIRLSGAGDVTDTNHVWQRKDIGTFVPTPVAFRNHIYLVRDRGEVACLQPASGKTRWSDAFPRSKRAFYASPLIAAGTLYAPREDGIVFVAQVDERGFEFVSENPMGEPVIGSPIPLSNRILIRGEQHLRCFGTPPTSLP